MQRRMLNKTPTIQIVKQVSLQRYVEKHMFLRAFSNTNFAVEHSFLASPSLLHKELTHESNCLSSRNLINLTSCLSTQVRGSYGALFRRWCYFIRNGHNPFRNPEYLTQGLICNQVYCSQWCLKVNCKHSSSLSLLL